MVDTAGCEAGHGKGIVNPVWSIAHTDLLDDRSRSCRMPAMLQVGG